MRLRARAARERRARLEAETIAERFAVRGLGVALAIDDSGTEYASFSYLRRLPVDVLKIDRSFVTDVAAAARDAAIVVGIVAMARALGVRTVAEGVETLEQARALHSSLVGAPGA